MNKVYRFMQVIFLLLLVPSTVEAKQMRKRKRHAKTKSYPHDEDTPDGDGTPTCTILEYGRQVNTLLKNGQPYNPMTDGPPQIGDLVSQSSLLCDGPCTDDNVIGSVHAEAAIVPGIAAGPPNAIRLGRGAYIIDGVGNIYFQGSVRNADAGGPFTVSIVGGTQNFACATGFIEIGAASMDKRSATFHLCGDLCVPE